MPENCTVLVVEDDELIRETLCSFLEAEGFQVTCCDSGLTAINHVQDARFSVIITDHGLPGANGVEIVRAVRSQNRSTYIIGVSAGRRESEFLEAGVDIFLHKPYSFHQLIDLARDSCNLSSGS